jgi:uncharacterized membrane protein YccC
MGHHHRLYRVANLGGRVLSRSLYRLAGTVAGAGATVLIVPTFVNTPMLYAA